VFFNYVVTPTWDFWPPPPPHSLFRYLTLPRFEPHLKKPKLVPRLFSNPPVDNVEAQPTPLTFYHSLPQPSLFSLPPTSSQNGLFVCPLPPPPRLPGPNSKCFVFFCFTSYCPCGPPWALFFPTLGRGWDPSIANWRPLVHIFSCESFFSYFYPVPFSFPPVRTPNLEFLFGFPQLFASPSPGKEPLPRVFFSFSFFFFPPRLALELHPPPPLFSVPMEMNF